MVGVVGESRSTLKNIRIYIRIRTLLLQSLVFSPFVTTRAYHLFAIKAN